MHRAEPHPADRRLVIGAWTLGFGLGGFFDGILLHQVLQWHHLLSLVEGETLRRIETQILADGAFHVLMYAITAAGLVLLWRGRRALDRAGADRRVIAGAVLGFSLWQFADVVLFHWILGIHRIRVDVPDPLLWDLGWLAVFGVPSLLLGLWLRRGRPADGSGGGAGRGVGAAVTAGLALVAAPLAALPPAGTTGALVLFGSAITPAQAFGAVGDAGGRVIWADSSGRLLAVDLEGAATARLYLSGALAVTRSPAVAGCLAWARTSGPTEASR